MTHAKLQTRTDGRHAVRLRYGAKHRRVFIIALTDRAEAQRRADTMVEVATRLADAGQSDHARLLLERLGAAATDADAAQLVRIADGLCSGGVVPDQKRVANMRTTFRQLGTRWTSGELARTFPDYVAEKRTAHVDEARLAKLCAIEVAPGQRLGDVPLVAFKVEHAKIAMANLPESAQRPATRRHYAQLIHRVLSLAAWPCEIIPANPLPKRFMPRVGDPPDYSYLYPEEDRKLLGHVEIPVRDRLFFGMLTREGLRSSEAQALVWAEIDLDEGTLSLDQNKTDDARAWVLDAGVVRALRKWRKRFHPDAGPDDLVFRDEHGAPMELNMLARTLRRALLQAGVTRKELHTSGTNRSRLRAHDLRGTFITLALANGKTEAWVMDRTGHQTSDMLARYKRARNRAEELHHGMPMPLDLAIPELRDQGGGHRVGMPTQSMVGAAAANQQNHKTSRSGGMADAVDSKSAVRKGVWVRLPPSAPQRRPRRAAWRRATALPEAWRTRSPAASRVGSSGVVASTRSARRLVARSARCQAAACPSVPGSCSSARSTAARSSRPTDWMAERRRRPAPCSLAAAYIARRMPRRSRTASNGNGC